MSQYHRDKQAYLNATPMQREVVRRYLSAVLGCLRAQYLSYQTSHWQVVGQSFYGNHLLFMRLTESVQEQVDQLAEKMVGFLGREAVDLTRQMENIWDYTSVWSQIGCHHKRGLQSESDLQAALKRAYDGIKQVNAMTLGLDDWIMATANAHEENEYLLQQALTPVPGQKQARPKSAGAFAGRTPSRGGFTVGGQVFDVADYEVDYDTGVVTVALERYDRGDIIESRALLEDFEDEVKKVVRQSTSRHVRDWLDKSFKAKKLPEQFRKWKVYRDESGELKGFRAASQKQAYFRDPNHHVVREFADSGAITNDVSVAEKAVRDDNLTTPASQVISDARKAPPTPTEIVKEPGGKALSTLNQYLVESEDPAVKQAAAADPSGMAAWLEELNR